jgi:hypothetical protein
MRGNSDGLRIGGLGGVGADDRTTTRRGAVDVTPALFVEEAPRPRPIGGNVGRALDLSGTRSSSTEGPFIDAPMERAGVSVTASGHGR